MITSGTYFVFPSESNLEIDSTGGLVKIVLPTAEAISTYISGSGGQVPEVIGYTIVGAATNPVRFYRGGGLLWNSGAEYLEITADGSGTISSSNGIQSISEAVLSSGASVASYKVYRAILAQSGTSAPTAIVLENTLGGIITWSRNGIGDYKGTCSVSGIFSDVTKCTFQPPVYDSDPSNNYSPFYNGGWYDADSVYLITSIVDYTTATPARADSILYSNRMMFVEVRVYN